MKSSAGLLAAVLFTAANSAADERVDYATQIKPLLATKCFACHGALKQESGLRLDAASLIRTGGDSGPVIVAENSPESHLIQRVTADDERMPPEGEGEPLTAEQIALLRRWIDEGAIAPDEPIPPNPRDHWAYRPPLRPDVPKPKNSAWVRNDIDAFLAAKHEANGLTPAPTAKDEFLLRRLYIDLVGLPPTRSELHAFAANDSLRGYERAVEHLLGRPQYGERWGRHWMDVWRYSDWAGYGNEIRYSQRHIWRWRDWIIESLNADKGYDRMILEMLAADELAPDDDDALRATGFLARNWYKFDRNVWLDDVVEHTGRAFLGTTFNCARCHDHKYDPIAQHEYFGLRAIFEPYNVRMDRAPGELDVVKDGLVRIYDANPGIATYFFQRGDPKRADKQHPVSPNVPAVFGGEFNVRPVSLPLQSYYPAMREFVAGEMMATAQASIETARAERNAARTKLAALALSDPKQTRTNLEQAVALAEKGVTAAEATLTSIKARVAAERAKYKVGQSSKLPIEALAKQAAKSERLAALAGADEKLLAATQELERAELTDDDAKAKQAVTAAQEKVAAAQKAFDSAKNAAQEETASYQPLGPTHPQSSTGRRLALARWITHRKNPLTARVAVNHLWMRHFGRPLVESVDDFGLRSPSPPLNELLDYLAVELMEHNWSMKHIHRLIVTSNAYRMASSEGGIGNPSRRLDPDNQLFWRMNSRRMEAETVRDSVFHVAGSLDLTRGGPEIDYKQGLTIPRRSLYFRHARERQMEFLQMFDPANPRECYRRQESIRPQQVFAMVNSSLVLAQSRSLAGKLTKEGQHDDHSFIVAAFETVLSRAPSDDESNACKEFLAMQARQLADLGKLDLLDNSANAVPPSDDPGQRARENLVLVLLNHNDFVTVR